MAKDKKFILKEFTDLKDIINTNEKNLIGAMSGYKKEFRDIASIVNSTLNGSEKDINAMMSSSKEFNDLVEELKTKCNKLNEIISEIGESAQNIKTDYSLDDDEFEKYIKLLAEYEKNQKQINELNSLPSLNPRQQALKDKLDNENNVISNKFTSSSDARVRDLFSNRDTDNNIKKYIEGLNDVEKKTQDIHITTQKVTESYEKGVEALNDQNKALEAVKKGVEYVFNYIGKGLDKWREIDEKIFTVGRQIGLSTKEIKNYQENVLRNYDNLAAKLGMTFEELFKFQETYTKNTGRAIGLTNQQVEVLGTMSKLVGETATNDMVKNMDDFGASTQTATSYLALNMARARSQGLDAQKASETFANNVKLASKYTFREGVNGISKMTLLSQKLKFNMDSIANASERFETVQDAIGTAANLQMLGGNYAAQFGNPLEAMNMAMLDMEGFTNKIVDTFSGKAIFNRETGQVEMSAIDKRLMKEAAKQLGISYEEAWNMASQKAKIGDVERQIGLNSNKFSDKEKDFITSKAQYDAETKQHYVTVYQDGEAKRVDVKDLTTDQLEIMRDQKDVEHAMYADVHGIHAKLAKYVGEDLSKNKSFNENVKGLDESIKINFANIHDYYMEHIVKPISTWMADGNWWIAALGLGAVGTGIGYYFKDFFSNTFNSIGSKVMNRAKSRTTSSGPSGSGSGSGASGSGASGSGSSSSGSGSSGSGSGSSGSGSGSGASGSGSSGSGSGASGSGSGASGSGSSGSGSKPKPKKKPSKSKKKSSKPKKKTPKPKSRGRKGGSLGISVNPFGNGAKPNFGKSRIGGLMNLGMSLLTLTNVASGFFNDGEEENISSGDSTLVNENNLLNVNNTEEIAELQKQTALLEVIANNYGIKKNNLNVESEEYQSLSDEIVNGETNSNAIVDNVLFGASMVSKLNPYAQIAMGAYDLYNAHSAYSDQIKAIDSSNLSEDEKDKLRRTASDKRNERYGEGIGGAVGSAIGGALGTMIPIPVVGTAIGAAVGNWVGSTVGGFIGKNVNKTKDFLFGKDNITASDKAQQAYEETKMGIVDIRDPQLEQKAQLATCQIHDIVVSMWHHMNGKQSNGLKEDKGLLGGFGDTVNTVNNTIGGALVSTITSPFKLVGGLVSSIFNGGAKSNVSTNKNEYSSISSQYVNALSTNNESVINGVSTNVSNINDLSRVDRQYISKASKSLGISEEEFYNQYSYSVNKNGYIANNTNIGGNPIRVYNDNEYDLRDPQQRRDYIISRELSRDRNRGRVAQNSYNRVESIKYSYQQLYGLEPKPYETATYNRNMNFAGNRTYSSYYNSDLSDVRYNNNKSQAYNSINGYNDLDYISHNSSAVDNISVKEVKYNNNGLMSKPTVGEPTYIKNTNDFINQNYNNSLVGNNKIDLNVTGSIKLTSDRGNNVDVDMSKLLNNSDFVRKLTEIITDSLNKNANGGRRENNSVGSLTYGSSLGTRNQSNMLYR